MVNKEPKLKDDGNYIHLNCSKINSRATIDIAKEITDLLEDRFSEHNDLIRLSIKADND